ncbi:hypothetical protein [Candidatus Formimonas warabiya]|uniref:Bacterial EndoU nuclease domain-containing protein n=1 Tax=Formimonas warabiya TaxID=1761012 RepID=A0A3G1KR54_FORW1|nr:hypothetical protein [Candidatus Formimonas warabiya]ATW24938.1 hypothetical protein DCMF_09280 [Candidatus Formimonas warabiya]
MDNPLSHNLYAYCGNNPISYTDPSGNMRCNQVDDLLYGLVQSLGESIKDIIYSPLAAWALVKDIKNGNLSLQDLADALGESVAGPIKHLMANSGKVWFGDPTDAQVQQYGKNLGYVIQEAIAVGGAVKTGIKVIDKMVTSTKTAKKVIAAEANSVLKKASEAAYKAADNIDSFTVSNKHLYGAGGNWNKFNTNDANKVNRIIKEALESQNAQFLPNNQPNSFKIEVDLGRSIGAKGETKVRVIIGDDGKIWTAFPIK